MARGTKSERCKRVSSRSGNGSLDYGLPVRRQDRSPGSAYVDKAINCDQISLSHTYPVRCSTAMSLPDCLGCSPLEFATHLLVWRTSDHSDLLAYHSCGLHLAAMARKPTYPIRVPARARY